MTGYERLVGALEGHGVTVKAGRDKQDVKCPAHDDGNPSLSIGQGDEKALMYCHNGCTNEQIVGVIGLPMAALFDDWKATEPRPSASPTLGPETARYEYLNADGSRRFDVVRYGDGLGKTFRQHLPGQSRGTLNGLTPVLYRLPEIIEAKQRGRWVVIVEGEKDADRLWGEGFAATTSPMGAGKWGKCDTAVLDGANVAVIGDNDETGRKHVAEVAADLTGRASTVRVLELEGVPVKGDVSDWLDNGGTASQIKEMIANAPEAEADDELPGAKYIPIDWASFWAEDHHQEYILDPVLPKGRLVAMYAKGKAGKSLITLEWAAALATGRAVLNQPDSDPIDVVYIDAEMTEADIEARLDDLGYGPDDDLTPLHYYLLQHLPPLDTPDGGEALIGIAEEHGAELVVIDTLSRVIAGKENEADTFLAFYNNTGKLLKAAGVTLLRLDHSGKDDKKGQRGSSAKNQDADIVWQLQDDGPLGATGEHKMTLTARFSRLQLEAERISITRRVEPLRHEMAGTFVITQGGTDVLRTLERLDVPVETGRKKARQILKAAGEKASNQHLTEAVRWRKKHDGHPDGHLSGDQADTPNGHPAETVGNKGPDTQTDTLGHPKRKVSGSVPPSEGGTRTSGLPVNDWRGIVEDFSTVDGATTIKVRGRAPRTFLADDLIGDAFGEGDSVHITPTDDGRLRVAVTSRKDPF